MANVPPAELVELKARILDEIKCTAAANSGVPLGQGLFEAGIVVSAWRGRLLAPLC